jgi:hypothetical protein|nr:MAG TPA: hypothetical protein [Caudoviricetes sp.]
MKKLTVYILAVVCFFLVMLSPVILAKIVSSDNNLSTEEIRYKDSQANVLLQNINQQYYDLFQMLKFYAKSNDNQEIDKLLVEGKLENACTQFYKSGINESKLSNYFIWTFISQAEDQIHRDIYKYNALVIDMDKKINNLNDVERVLDKYRGG